MKRIKIKPLKTVDELNLNIASQKHYKIDASLMDGLMETILNITKDVPDVIIAQGKEGESHAISTKISTNANKTFVIPEPNLILIYLRIAFDSMFKSKDTYAAYEQADNNTEVKFDALNNYLDPTITAVTFFITSIEAYLNQLLPDNFKMVIKEKELNKSEIEWKDLDTKIKVVLPEIKKIDFYKSNPKEYESLIELKKIRNSLVHLKKISLENKTSYQQLIENLTKINLDKYSKAVTLFFKTVDPVLVEEE